jgi:hypothetical protein
MEDIRDKYYSEYDKDIVDFCYLTHRMWFDEECGLTDCEFKFWQYHKTHSNWIINPGINLEFHNEAKECYLKMYSELFPVVSC